MARPKPEWYTRNPKISTRLSTDQKDRLEAVLKTRGQNLTDWIRVMMEQCAAERLPESQGDVKKVIPIEVADLAQKVLDCEGDRLMRAANKITDRNLRKKRRKEAAAYFDAADWFAGVIVQGRYRRHILNSGRRQPRHRHISDQADREPDQASN